MNETVNVYNRLVDDYVRIADDQPPTLDSFLQGLAPRSRVLDLGCGPGHHARRISEAGHSVLAVDGSDEMIKHAKLHPGVIAQKATFDAISTLGEFDGVWASFSLLHARRADVPRHIHDIHKICAADALFSITLKAGSGEKHDELGRFYSYFSQSELHDYLTDAGFSVEQTVTGETKGMAGTLDPWVNVQARA